MNTVLLDLTPLNTSQRSRGIGRHIRELTLGLSKLDRDTIGPLQLVGLTRLDATGGFATTEDPSSFEGLTEIRDPSVIDDERATWSRRVLLWRAAAKIGANLVHVPDPSGTPWPAPHREARRVVTCHDLAILRPGANRALPQRGFLTMRKRQAAWRFRGADHVIAISSYTAEDLNSLLGLNTSRVSVVYNGVDLSKWPASTPSGGGDTGELSRFGLRHGAYALYVGEAAWRKNRAGMLRGLRHARELRPELGLQLAWAGRLSAREASTVDREARNLGIRHAVHLLQYVNDQELAALYRGAAAHLLVSRHEGFGLTAVEAMACGCPVITTRRTALAEVAGDAAVHVDPEDHDAIGEALNRVATDPALRSDLRTRGLARAAMFSNRRQAEQTVGIYRRVLGV